MNKVRRCAKTSLIWITLLISLCACADKTNTDNSTIFSDTTPGEATVTPIISAEIDDSEYYSNDMNSDHGQDAVMETETGYYYEADIIYDLSDYKKSFYTGLNGHRLCYYDKESQKMKLICNVPKCRHDGGETCVATYRNIGVISTLLYENEIFIYGLDREGTRLELCLWRAGLDGSYIEKVATILEADNPEQEEFKITKASPPEFIIHRGSAYIAYYLNVGNSSFGFIGGGIMRVHLGSGETENVYEMERNSSPVPMSLNGCGEYVFFYLDATNGGLSCAQSYSLREQTVEDGMYADAYGYSRLYRILPVDVEKPEKGYVVKCYNVDSEPAGEDFPIDISVDEYKKYREVFFYEEKLIIIVPYRVLIFGVGDDDYGKKLGEISYDFSAGQLSYDYKQYNSFKACNGRIYRIQRPVGGTKPAFGGVEDYTMVDMPVAYSCEIDDVIAGEGEWVVAYPFLYNESPEEESKKSSEDE